MTYFTWNDGLTPRVDFGYDIASRLITINNANATISRQYFNDDLLRVETEQITGGPLSQLVYTYDGNGNRASAIIWPGNASFDYLYTWRNQLEYITDNVSGALMATYVYDPNGNLSSRSLANWTSSTYTYDALDRVTWVVHALNGTGRTFRYGYETDNDNRKWAKRLISPPSSEANKGEVFDYDLADQATAVKLNILNPDTASAGLQKIFYDANGNRTSFAPYGTTDTYTINNLNQYTRRNTTNAAYDLNGNLTIGVDLSTYSYDAQNRLLTANSGPFKYDGLNRQVSRTVDGVITYSAWDGWDLVQEYQGNQGSTITATYLHGASGLVKEMLTNNYYYQDGSGSTSHLANSGGALLEWYRYDLQGTPIYYNAADVQITASNYGVRHLFTGQQWYSELGLYDLRNRFYSPDIGRFLQPDPIGFAGDPTNLYRYCGNNPVKWRDPSGFDPPYRPLEGLAPPVEVFGNGFPTAQESPFGNSSAFGLGDPAIWGGGGSTPNYGGGRVRPSRPPAIADGERVVVTGDPVDPASPPPQNPFNELMLNQLLFDLWMGPFHQESAIYRLMRLRGTRDGSRQDTRRGYVFMSHYGYPTDRTPDPDTQAGLGLRNTRLDANSLALTPDLQAGFQLHDPIYVYANGWFYLGRYDDAIGAGTLTIDFYDPYGFAGGEEFGVVLPPGTRISNYPGP